MAALYDTIGKGYAARRRTDPRIAAALWLALGDAEMVVNVGAGAGSYEPRDRAVVAVEPSLTMIRQRPPDAAPVLQAVAEQLPLRDASVAAAMAVLTVHHWRNVSQGLTEMRRVSRDRIVILTCDPAGPGFWLTDEYFPAIRTQDSRKLPGIPEFEAALGPVSVNTVPIPRHCQDGFLGAFWAHPHAYLDAGVRSGISVFAGLPGLQEGLLRLREDLDSGIWQRRFGALVAQDELDIGYRLVIADLSGRRA
ncbi:MAG: methyltransferase domain-containing protein [Steroidobacteraceae bacterium]